jgi:translation initiation factor eIF-2B subunit delta
MAHAAHVPVLVACETYKFHERVQLDAITLNELQDPDALVEAAPPRARLALQGWRDLPALRLLALAYDITLMYEIVAALSPSSHFREHVDAIITELGLIPPTAVPVVLREAAQRQDEVR